MKGVGVLVVLEDGGWNRVEGGGGKQRVKIRADERTMTKREKWKIKGDELEA